MTKSRYSTLAIVSGSLAGVWTSPVAPDSLLDGLVTVDHPLERGERLDHVAARYLGDGALWWVVALVNNIAWGFPTPGTLLRVPVDRGEVLRRLLG